MIFGFHFLSGDGKIDKFPFRLPFRGWDNGYCQWIALQPNETTNVSTGIKQIVQAYGDVLVCLGPTPAWATSSQVMGQYSYVGSNAYPDKVTDDQLTALIGNLISAGVRAIEPINEVTLEMGWTCQQVVDWSRRVFQITKSINPNVIVLSPSWNMTDDNFKTCLNLGLDTWVDVWSLHVYADTHKNWFGIAEEVTVNFRKLSCSLKPIWITEAGCQETGSMTYQQWENTLRKLRLLSLPQYNVQRFYFYAYEAGNFRFDTDQAKAVLSRANT